MTYHHADGFRLFPYFYHLHTESLIHQAFICKYTHVPGRASFHFKMRVLEHDPPGSEPIEALFTSVCRSRPSVAETVLETRSRQILVTWKFTVNTVLLKGHWRIQGGRQGRAPLGPISYIFVQFSAKILPSNRCQGLVPPSGKSWIRYWRINQIHY